MRHSGDLQRAHSESTSKATEGPFKEDLRINNNDRCRDRGISSPRTNFTSDGDNEDTKAETNKQTNKQTSEVHYKSNRGLR